MKKASICGNPGCQGNFVKKRPWQKYCSDQCRMEGWIFKKARSLNAKKTEEKGQ